MTIIFDVETFTVQKDTLKTHLNPNSNTKLDELKTFVRSLKNKQLKPPQLINAITQKIDTLKVTGAEELMRRQQVNGANLQLYKALAEKYPVLSNLEIRMCGLLQTGMTNRELSKLYGQGERTYEQHRYRIKKKMSLTAKDNLVKHLVSLSAGS